MPKSAAWGGGLGNVGALPFLADVDKIFAVLQGSLTTVKVGGTLEAPTVTPGVFADLGQGLRKILLGDVQAETRGSAGQ